MKSSLNRKSKSNSMKSPRTGHSDSPTAVEAPAGRNVPALATTLPVDGSDAHVSKPCHPLAESAPRRCASHMWNVPGLCVWRGQGQSALSCRHRRSRYSRASTPPDQRCCERTRGACLGGRAGAVHRTSMLRLRAKYVHTTGCEPRRAATAGLRRPGLRRQGCAGTVLHRSRLRLG